MKLSREMKWLLGGSGLVLVFVLALVIMASSGSTRVEGIADPNVCEFCGRPLPSSKVCLTCSAEMGREVYEAKREQKHWYNSPVAATTIISLLCVLVSAHIGILLYKQRGRKKEEFYFYTRCSKCGRKLRYRESQIARLGKCPICQKPIIFPKPPPVRKVSRWVRIKDIVWG
jgi:hypothetical protein